MCPIQTFYTSTTTTTTTTTTTITATTTTTTYILFLKQKIDGCNLCQLVLTITNKLYKIS